MSGCASIWPLNSMTSTPLSASHLPLWQHAGWKIWLLLACSTPVYTHWQGCLDAINEQARRQCHGKTALTLTLPRLTTIIYNKIHLTNLRFKNKLWLHCQVFYLGGLTFYPCYSFGNVNIFIFPITAVCSNVQNLSQILQPELSRTETALILLMTIPLPLHAVSRVWPWPLAARHALSVCSLSAFRLDTTPFAINLKMLLMCTQQMDYLSSLDEKVDAMLTIKLVSCVQKRLIQKCCIYKCRAERLVYKSKISK